MKRAYNEDLVPEQKCSMCDELLVKVGQVDKTGEVGVILRCPGKKRFSDKHDQIISAVSTR